MPLFFSSNLIFGRGAVGVVEPFTLAFLRWLLTTLILLPFVWSVVSSRWQDIRSMGPLLLGLGFLGMWVCGALVYYALQFTTATNATLIYTSSPVIIILIEWAFRGRPIGMRDGIGVLLALNGVIVIVVKGSYTNLINLSFNFGDLIFVCCAIAWAVYSVGLKSSRLNSLSTLPTFMLIAGSGAFLLAPFALAEIVITQKFPTSFEAWQSIVGIVAFASLLAFSSFQYGVKVLGASVSAIFMYLLPVYGVGLAVIFLGEQLAAFHFWGIVLVLSGVVIATLPTKAKRLA